VVVAVQKVSNHEATEAIPLVAAANHPTRALTDVGLYRLFADRDLSVVDRTETDKNGSSELAVEAGVA
jgi:hypothetical protein